MKKAYKYENLQIGNFLLSIGYYLRDFDFKFPVSMNLYQQTPKDFNIGDLFGGLAGQFFILEFKNDESSISDELRKKQRRRLVERLNLDKELLSISLKGHFICYPSFTGEGMNFNITPYSVIGSKHYEVRKIKGVDLFLKKMILDKTVGTNFEGISKYVGLLDECSINEGETSPKGGGGLSGIFIHFNEKDGIRYIPFDDLKFLEQNIRLQKEIDLDALKPKINLKLDRKKGMGR